MPANESEIISGLDNVDHKLIYKDALKALGDGPMRFAPTSEISTAEQTDSLEGRSSKMILYVFPEAVMIAMVGIAAVQAILL